MTGTWCVQIHNQIEVLQMSEICWFRIWFIKDAIDSSKAVNVSLIIVGNSTVPIISIACKTYQEKIKPVRSDLFLEWGWTEVILLSRIRAKFHNAPWSADNIKTFTVVANPGETSLLLGTFPLYQVITALIQSYSSQWPRRFDFITQWHRSRGG